MNRERRKKLEELSEQMIKALSIGEKILKKYEEENHE